MSYVIRVEGFADGAPCPVAGWFVQSFDHDAAGGLGSGDFTLNPRRALRFGSRTMALLFWRQQSRKRPLRPDGQPNRPLTASSVTIAPLSDFIRGYERYGNG